MFWLSFLMNIPVLIFLSFFFARKTKDQPLRRFYYPALFFKVIAGVSVGLVYLWVYDGKGDTWTLFHKSVLLNDLLWEKPEIYFDYFFTNTPDLDAYLGDPMSKAPRALIFAKILSLINIFSLNNYWVTGMYLSLFSFLGMYSLANSIVRIFKTPYLSVLISFLFFPSVVFWSAGIMKESILMGALGLLVSFVLSSLYEKRKFAFPVWLFMMLAALAVFYIKYYYFIVLLPALISLAVTYKIYHRQMAVGARPFAEIGTFLTLFGVIALSGTLLVPQLNLNAFLKVLLENYQLTLESSNEFNAIRFSGLNENWASLLAQFPKALTAGLFRPWPGDVRILSGYGPVLENMLVLIFFLSSLIYCFIKRPVFANGLILTVLLVYIMALAFLLPIASPNWGGLVRYKVGYLPFFLLLITFRNPFIFYLESKLLKKKADA
ncbi:MAG: hypothetical protein ACJ75J_02935 [Cytophagaceae bacterium]